MGANVWAERVEATTLVTADNAGESWTKDEIDFVVAFTDDARDEEIAVSLGRSLYAIWAIQSRIRRGEIVGASSRVVAKRAWDVGYDYVTTFPPE